MGWTTSLLLLSLLGLSACQQRSLRNTGNGRQRLQSGKPAEVADFNCPQDFGYYPHPTDCTQYYVCVFGGALQESCTGGLVYSHELETCDWPRNVDCQPGATGGGVSTIIVTDPRTRSSNTRPISPVTESLTPSVGFDKFDHSFSSTKNHRTTQTLNGPDRSGNERALFRNPSSKSQFLSSHFSSSSFFNAPGTSGSTNRRPTKSTSFTPSWQQSLVRVTREAPTPKMRRRDLTPLDASRDSDPGLSLKPRDSLTASSSASSTRHHQSVAAAATSTSSASDPFPHVPSKHHHGITRRQSPFPQQGLLPKHFQTPQHTRFSLKPKTKSSQSSLTSSFHRQSFPSNPFGGYSSFGSSFDTSPFSGHGREQVQHRPPPQQQLRPHHKQRPRPHTDPLRHRPHSQSFPPLRPHAATLPPSRFQEALFPSARPQTDGFPFTSFDDLYPTRPDSEPFLPEEAKPQPNDPAFHPPLDEQQLSYPPRPARPTPRPPHVLSQPTYSPHVPPRFPPALPPSSHPHFSHDVPESKFPPHFHIKTTTSPPATTPAATPRPPVHRPRPTTFRPRSQPSHPRHTTTSRPTTTTTTPPPPPPPSVSKTPPHVSRPRPTTTTTTRRPRVRSTTPKTTTFLPRLTTHSPRHVASHSPRQRPRPYLNSIETLDEYEDETNPFQNPAVEIRTQAPETTTRFTFPPFSKARSTTAVPFGGKKDDQKSPALAPPPQIPGTVRHPELSRLPASSLKTPDSPKTSPKHTQDNAKPSRYPVDPFP